MTRSTNARVAGFTFLLYIAVGVSGMVLPGRAASGDIAAKLASVAQHPTATGVRVMLALLECFSALVLAVTLYALTRDEDRELALLAFACRVGEGLLAAFPVTTLGILWLATASGSGAPDAATANTLGALLLKAAAWKTMSGATLFAVGSTIFSWLFLRGRTIPVALAWLGVVASVLLVAGLPLQLAGFLHGTVTTIMWLPMAAFEIPLGIWLLVTGAPLPAHRRGEPAGEETLLHDVA